MLVVVRIFVDAYQLTPWIETSAAVRSRRAGEIVLDIAVLHRGASK